MDEFKHIKAVIFDLDGTLYQDDIVCYDLIRRFAAGTEYEEMTEEIVSRSKEILEGKREIVCGCFAKKETAAGPVSLDHLFDFPTYKGLAAKNVKDYFERTVYSYIGESWTLAMFIGHRLGFYGEEFWKRFKEARRGLLTGPGRQKKDPQILRMMRELRERGVVLLLCTNSTHENSNALLHQLGLTECFDELIHNAGKPSGLTDRIELLRKNYRLDYGEILLAGDQGYNDLYPGWELGTKTLLTNPYVTDDGMDWTHRVHGMDGLINALRG